MSCEHPLSLPGFGREMTPSARMQSMIYPQSIGLPADSDLATCSGVDDVYMTLDGSGVVVWENGTRLTLPPTSPYSCGHCGHTGIGSEDGDACDHCTFWLEGEPMQTPEHAVSVLTAFLSSYAEVLEEQEWADVRACCEFFGITLEMPQTHQADDQADEDSWVSVCTCGSWPEMTHGPSNRAHEATCGLMTEGD